MTTVSNSSGSIGSIFFGFCVKWAKPWPEGEGCKEGGGRNVAVALILTFVEL